MQKSNTVQIAKELNIAARGTINTHIHLLAVYTRISRIKLIFQQHGKRNRVSEAYITKKFDMQNEWLRSWK